LTYVHTYPLVRSGGVFLLVVGLAMLPGAMRFPARQKWLAAGAVLAAVATALAAVSLTRPYGTPSGTQVAWLAGAVLLEMLLIPQVVRHFHSQGERAVTLAVLTAAAGAIMWCAPLIR
jgi:hypothetical protein